MTKAFHGAKAAVFIGEQILLYRRDAHVRWGNMWDMPGGGREGDETPKACLAREVFEEFGLDIADAVELWAQAFPAMADEGQVGWFFVVQFPGETELQIRFGDEGQDWRLFSIKDAIALPDLIAPLRDRLNQWLRQRGHGGG